MSDSKYLVSNVSNYLSDYEYSNAIDYVFKYIELIHQYLNYSKEYMYVQDLTLNKYIIIKGLELLNNIFNLLLLYTKNLDLTVYNTQKAYCYYVEFIGQIGDENNSFLKLSTKDALVFIYRKIIYNINQEMRANFKVDETRRNMLYMIKDTTTLYNTLLFKTIETYETPFQKNDDETLHFIIKSNTALINKYIKTDVDIKIFTYIHLLTDTLFTFTIDKHKIYLILESFVKKYKKMKHMSDKELFEIIKKNTLMLKHEGFQNDISISKLTNRFFQV